MKKIFSFLLVFFLMVSFSYAQIGKTLFRANVRNLPNTHSSKILFVSQKGQNFEIIKKINYSWYEIKLDNGKIAYIWDQAIKLEKNYNLTSLDKKIIEKFVSILSKKNLKTRKIFLEKLKNLKIKKKNNLRIYTILDKIINHFELTPPPLGTPLKNGRNNENNIQKNSIKKEKNNKENIQKKLTSNDYIKYNINKIRKTWISWHNEVRKKMGLPLYTEEKKLNISAKNWSITNRNAKKIDHRRHPGDSYYDYKKVTKWMKDNGVVCKNIFRATYSESIARGWMTCNKDDCTQEIIKTLRGAFDYFMSEKGVSGIAGAHYRAIVHPRFKQIGFDIAIEKIGKNSYRVYSTTHYCTQVQ